MMRCLLVALGLALLSPQSAMAQKVTLQGLMTNGFRVVGTFMSSIGPALFLQNDTLQSGDRLYLCFVEEMPTSDVITTRYCKPVR